ncbi:hypothetical protein C8F04DRAFT_1130341 [Mycena alexandri]|uniref:Membrane anchor Opy2 N-terminal domain-containing protein n=1 Tax=Mycena alexandri TaxID=1745969 RepID=A0AAD6SEY4_9AGAR|nr:hypothetical protein C8F04DRAFT_1130341 [Mycena alexandri]
MILSAVVGVLRDLSSLSTPRFIGHPHSGPCLFTFLPSLTQTMRLTGLLVVASAFTLAMSQSSTSSPGECIQCPTVQTTCPPCAVDEYCAVNARSCTACASVQCVLTSGSSSNSSASQSGSSVPASLSSSATPSPSGTSAALHPSTNLGALVYLISGLAAIGQFGL